MGVGMKKTIVYIDGLNLYYSLLKGTKYRWLDIEKLMISIFHQHNDIVAIKYFTATVLDDGSGAIARQNDYLDALAFACPHVQIIRGHFDRYKNKMVSTHDNTLVEVWKTEEKKTDVNLATHLINDAHKNLCDCAILLSNDTDFLGALQMYKTEFPEKTLGYLATCKIKPKNPNHAYTQAIKKVADFHKLLTQADLKDDFLLPNPVHNGDIYYQMPNEWQ